LAFLVFALEGVICLLMALPLALPLAAMGGLIAYYLQRLYRPTQSAPAILGALLLALPLGITLEHAATPRPPSNVWGATG
jgi:ABC-type dipeptide/oligopeptide/nickel transport system permease subunit